MKLYTECTWGDWHKVVDIYSERCDILPEYINDDSTYKIVILEKGSLLISKDGKDQEIKAPVLILLNNEDRLNYKTVKPVKACIVFFKPAAIRDEFDFERVGTGEFEKTQGQIIYQDYLLIRCFLQENQADRVTSLPVTGLKHTGRRSTG